MEVGFCYCLHISPPYAGATHYIGWASDVPARVARHLEGRGARLVRLALEKGRTVELVVVWENATREDEKRLKRSWKGKGCPRCEQANEMACLEPSPKPVEPKVIRIREIP